MPRARRPTTPAGRAPPPAPTTSRPAMSRASARASLAPPEPLDSPSEGGHDLRGKVVRAERGGSGWLPAEGCARDRGCAPRPGGILRRDHRREADLEPPSILENH